MLRAGLPYYPEFNPSADIFRCKILSILDWSSPFTLNEENLNQVVLDCAASISNATQRLLASLLSAL